MTNPTNQASGVAEPDDDLQSFIDLARIASTENHYSGGRVVRFEFSRDDMVRFHAALAAKPAAPAEVVAQWQIKNGGQWCNVDREPEELFKAKLPVRALYERTPAQAPSTGAVYLVATGEVVDCQETYTRHEGAPPPLCDFERLYAAPPVVQPASPAVEVAAFGYVTKDSRGVQHFFKEMPYLDNAVECVTVYATALPDECPYCHACWPECLHCDGTGLAGASLSDAQIDAILSEHGWLDDAYHDKTRRQQIRETFRRTIERAWTLGAQQQIAWGEEQSRSKLVAATPHPAVAVPGSMTDALERLIHDVRDLMENSEGVAGLHMNGDLAPWSDLKEGGRYSSWLGDALEQADAALATTSTAAQPESEGGA